jgi:hypothetical protein
MYKISKRNNKEKLDKEGNIIKKKVTFTDYKAIWPDLEKLIYFERLFQWEREVYLLNQ